MNRAGDKFCFKSGSKAAEISHRSARISTSEDERASQSPYVHIDLMVLAERVYNGT